MSYVISELRAKWQRGIEQYDDMIAFLDKGHKLRPAGASEEQAAAETAAWRKQMVHSG